jgi:hypothetical protein
LSEGKKVLRTLRSLGQEKVSHSSGVRLVRGDSTFWYDFNSKKSVKESWQTSDFDSIFALNLPRLYLSNLNLRGEIGACGWRKVGVAGMKEM